MKIFILSLLICLPAPGPSLAGEAPRPPARAPACTELRDQYDAPQRLAFPATNVILLTIADKKGSEQIDGWVAALKSHYARRIDWRGLAAVGGVPGLLRGKVRKRFQETRSYLVMMDWSGQVCAQFGYEKDVANLLVLDRQGVVQTRVTGAATPASVAQVRAALDELLVPQSKPASEPGPP